MTPNKKIEHDGIVKNVTADTVDVIIENLSACAGCHAKSACGMADAKRKTITAELPSFPIAAGDKVTVYASLHNAVYSVILAYVIPVFIIMLLLFLLLYSGWDELFAAVGALGGIAVYFTVLYLNRRRIGKNIKFTVEKN